MGTVPVAPKSIKLVSEGDRNVNGFNAKSADLGLINMEMMYTTALVAMIITPCGILLELSASVSANSRFEMCDSSLMITQSGRDP